MIKNIYKLKHSTSDGNTMERYWLITSDLNNKVLAAPLSRWDDPYTSTEVKITKLNGSILGVVQVWACKVLPKSLFINYGELVDEASDKGMEYVNSIRRYIITNQRRELPPYHVTGPDPRELELEYREFLDKLLKEDIYQFEHVCM